MMPPTWKLGTIFALFFALSLSASFWNNARERQHLLEARRIWLHVAATATATRRAALASLRRLLTGLSAYIFDSVGITATASTTTGFNGGHHAAA